MDRLILDQMLTWFQDWVDGLITTSGEDKEPFFEAILEHTYRVRQHAVALGKSEGLDDEQLMLLEMVTLFHDLGRFRELYMTTLGEFPFAVDHGESGVRLIKRLPFLNLLTQSEQVALIESVRHHGDFRCPPELDEQAKWILNILRDADKIDSYYKECHRRDKFSHVSPKGVAGANDYSASLVSVLMTGKPLHSEQLVHRLDKILLLLGYLFDFNYVHSFQVIEQNQYVDKLLDKLPQDPIILELRQMLHDYMDSKLPKE